MSPYYPSDLQYSDSHEYLRVEEDIAVMGITAFAIDQLGDIVFVELPAIGAAVTLGDEFGTVESVKAVSSLYSMVSGEVVAVNQAAIDAPEMLADDPYGDGWLVKVRMSDPDELQQTLSADQYQAMVGGM